jgi:hypothetical protein
MPLRIRFQYPSGSSLGYSIERLSDGTFFDFNDSTFKPTPTTLIVTLPEDAGNFVGRYKATLASTPPAQFTDGDYAVSIHNGGSANSVVGELSVVMHAGSDSTVIPGGAVASVNAPVTVGTNNDKAGYALAPAGLDAITVETGVNARQALSPILAASAGVLLGAGTGTIVIKGGNVAVTRIIANTDNAGNRTAVTLSLPT